MAVALNPEPAAGLPGVSSCYVLCHCHAALHKVHLCRCCTLTSHWSSVTSPCQHHKHQEACYHALSKTHALLHSTKVAHSMKMLLLDATALPEHHIIIERVPSRQVDRCCCHHCYVRVPMYLLRDGGEAQSVAACKGNGREDLRGAESGAVH